MNSGNETPVKAVAILVIVAGVLVAGAASTKFWFMNAEAERRNAETEREVLRLNEAERARERAQDEAVRAHAEAEALGRARIAPMPREKPVPDLDAQKARAHLGCQIVNGAMRAYTIARTNPGKTPADRLPRTVRDLMNPPWGGTSFLPNGEADSLDPWGKPYTFEPHELADGTPWVLVLSFAPDNVPISQFGIGDKARPQK